MGLFDRRRSLDELIRKAGEMRHAPTPSERRLLELMARAFGRSRFRHQRIVGPYIVDFPFPEERLVVEVDGSAHDGLRARFRDARRDDYLRSRGHYVLRVRNEDVFEQPDAVLEEVGRLLQRRSTAWGRFFAGRRRF